MSIMQLHKAVEDVASEASRMIALDYQEGCQTIDSRHMKTIAELISALAARPQVKVWHFLEGFVVELRRPPSTVQHWAEVGAQHRPGRFNRHHMSIFMVLGVRWVEFGVDAVTVGL